MVNRCCAYLGALFLPVNYCDDPDYVKAETWYNDVVSRTDLRIPGDSPAFAYSVSRYEELAEAKKHIEDKADSLLRFVSTVAGGMAAALVTLSKTTGLGSLGWLCIPSFIAFGFSAVVCLQVRRTSKWPSPFDPRFTVDMALDNFPENRTRAISIAATHCSVVGARFVVGRLSQRLNCANWAAVFGLLSLALLAFAS